MNAPNTALTVRGEVAGAIARNDDADVVDFPSLVAMGDQLVKTGFLPDHIRTGTQFAAIVMTGKELGMTTMRATRSLFLVKGKVIEDAASQLARFKAAGGHAKFLELDETKAVLWLKHPNSDEHTETWTVEDSKRAGLVGGNHEKHRKAMLRSRAITSGLKSVGWDGAVGAYDAAEFAEEVSTPPPSPTPKLTEKTVTTPAPKGASPEMQKKVAVWLIGHCAALDRCETQDEFDRLVKDNEEKVAALGKVDDRLPPMANAYTIQAASKVGGFEIEMTAEDLAALKNFADMRERIEAESAPPTTTEAPAAA